MSKAQRARLTELKAKTTTTEAEKAELAQLETLAVANPDASKDTDAAPVTPVTGPAPTTITGVLATAFAAVRNRAAVGADLVAVRAELATRTTELSAARAETVTARAETETANALLATATAQIGAIASFFGIKATELAGKDAAACSVLLTQKISDAALDQVAGLGFNAGAVLPVPTQTENSSTQKTFAEFSSLTPAQKMEFSVNGGRIVD